MSVTRSGQWTTIGLRVAAEVEPTCPPTLERSVRPMPRGRVVRVHHRAAPVVEAAVPLGELELHLVGEGDAVLHGQSSNEPVGDPSMLAPLSPRSR